MTTPAGPEPSTANLLGQSCAELEELCVKMGHAAYRGRQLYRGLYQRHAASVGELSELARPLREELATRFVCLRPRLDRVQAAADGTRKYRFLPAAEGAGDAGGAFEAVYIPEVAEGSRTNTLCVSSQTGCSLGCAFCFTATLRQPRNLTAAEILGGVLAVQEEVAAQGEAARVSNVVFMGMGEPLLNYEAVVKSARILVDPKGFDFSTRRVTVSTAGVVPRLADLGRDLDTQLAVSLNATTDEVRDRIMPINKKWPLAALIAALRAFPLKPRRRITIEYVMLAGINDTVADARRLVRLLDGIRVKVNLLPLNPHARAPFTRPEPEVVERFAAELRRRGVTALQRTARGQEIAAACGQLGEAAP